MYKIRKALDRGHANHGWLDTCHTFSFAGYHDPDYMGFADLRVINDDRIAGNKGFGKHPHNNMEIVTFVLDGELAHKDSMGNGSTIKPYDVQRMSAGKGITHSEFNPSSDETRILQVWILPKEIDIEPSYEQKHFSKAERAGIKLLVTNDGRQGSVGINQDTNIYGSYLNEELSFNPVKGCVYIHVFAGELKIGGETLNDGDGIAITDESEIVMSGNETELLLFEMN